MERYFPQEIQGMVGNQDYVRNEIGMSASEVLIFPEHVLKIQEQSPETDNEKVIVDWLHGRIPVPEVPAYVIEDGQAYTLMSKVKGRMLCDSWYLNDLKRLIQIAAKGLKLLWSVDIGDCPCRVSRLEERLKAARYNVEHGLVDVDNVQPETFGPGGFRNPEELLDWLEQNQLAEELVFSHGDFCLPNIFAEGGEISGFIDLGRMGPADRWQDVALCLRSLKDNLNGQYSGGMDYAAFEPQMLLDELGMEMDEEKMRYYVLLDELF